MVVVTVSVIPASVALWAALVAYHRGRVIRWVDEREKYVTALIMVAKAATTGAQPHSDAEWGYSMGMPSANSLQLVELARTIEKERAKWAGDIQRYFSALEIWEAHHPVPSYWDYVPSWLKSWSLWKRRRVSVSLPSPSAEAGVDHAKILDLPPFDPKGLRR